MNKKILVTGGAGYLGTMLTAHLLWNGYEVTVFDKCFFGAHPLIAFPKASFQFIRGDVRDSLALLNAMKGSAAVVHLAAVVGEPACSIDLIAARSINLGGTELVLSLAQQCEVEKLVFLSTCSNYGISVSNTLTTEDSPLNPLSEYAVGKVLAEQMIVKNEGSLAAVILRFGTICGLSPQMRFDLLVNELARDAAMNRPMKIFAPEAWRPFLHIQDAVSAIECCLKAPCDRLKGNVFNVVSQNCQKKDLMGLVQKHYPSASIEEIHKAPDLRDYRVSGAKIENDLGFIPSYTIEQAFLDVSRAVQNEVFSDPFHPGFSAIPRNPEILKFS